MTPAKQSAAERIRRGSSVTQPAAGRAVTGDVRVKPVRVSVDLDPQTYDALRDWAHQARMTHSAVLRTLVGLLIEDPALAAETRNRGSAEPRNY
ncbi:MAG: hypothetical protein ACRDV9_15550 [Acidimicrobiia bacterium]